MFTIILQNLRQTHNQPGGEGREGGKKEGGRENTEEGGGYRKTDWG